MRETLARALRRRKRARGSLSRTDTGERADALSQHRAESRTLTFRSAVIRDQRPMPPRALEKCLRDGVTPSEWFRLLNSKVFFWLDVERVNRHRLACRTSAQLVLVIDAARLLAVHGARASVTPFNSGNAMRKAAPRNHSSFVPYESWRAQGWREEQVSGARPRPVAHRPIELAISGSIPDAMTYVREVVVLSPGQVLSRRS